MYFFVCIYGSCTDWLYYSICLYQLYKQERSRATTPPERTFGQADADGERATTSSSSSKEGNIFSQDVSVVRMYSSGEEVERNSDNREL